MKEGLEWLFRFLGIKPAARTFFTQFALSCPNEILKLALGLFQVLDLLPLRGRDGLALGNSQGPPARVMST